MVAESPEAAGFEEELLQQGFTIAPGSLTYLPAGRINDNFSLSIDGKPAVLRVWKESTDEHAASELAVLRRLAEADLRCVRPLEDQGDRPIVIRGRPAALFDFVEGMAYRRESREAHAAMCGKVGPLLAQAHGAAAGLERLPFRQRPYADRLIEYKTAAFSLDLGTFGPRVESIVAKTQELADQVQALANEDHLPYGVVHGDPGEWNFLIDEQGPWLLDFDMCHRDLLAYDIAQLISQWASYAGEMWDAGLARMIVDAYDDVRPLSTSERRAVALSAPLRQAVDTLGALPYFSGPDAPDSFANYLDYFDGPLGVASDESWFAAF